MKRILIIAILFIWGLGAFLLRPFVVRDVKFALTESIVVPDRTVAFVFETLYSLADSKGRFLVDSVDSNFASCADCQDEDFEYYISDRRVRNLWYTNKEKGVLTSPHYWAYIEREAQDQNDSIFIYQIQKPTISVEQELKRPLLFKIRSFTF
jgi:hypothetical protein